MKLKKKKKLNKKKKNANDKIFNYELFSVVCLPGLSRVVKFLFASNKLLLFQTHSVVFTTYRYSTYSKTIMHRRYTQN